MFSPASMRVHPIFTQMKDWTGDGKPDGVEADLQFEDQFGDPIKAAGRVLFELYDYRKNSPDPRGPRVCDPWTGALDTLSEQKEHWSNITGTYSFRLSFSAINPKKEYVLQATFEKAGGGRFFDQIVIEPPVQEKSRVQPTSLPGTTPGGRAPQP